MNTIQLTQKLISIPSYVTGKTNEKAIGEFVFCYLARVPGLKVSKQKIGEGRFNVIANTKGKPRLLLAGHLDTVEPKQGWQTNQFRGMIQGSRLYGLGALDTKAGIAAAMSSLTNFTNVSGLTLLFYCDEEYDFQGMKQFIKKQEKRKDLWELAVVIEPTDLKIWNTHKGLIEISFSAQGKSGHAANPASGNNAIEALMFALEELRVWLKQFQNKALGAPTLNIAYIRGGLKQGFDDKGTVVLGQEGNNIADFAEVTIDIRPTTATLRARDVLAQIEATLRQRRVRLLNYSIRHDLGALHTDKEKLKVLERSFKKNKRKVEYFNGMNAGYGDGQFLERLKIPVAYIGPRGKNAHGPNEWVDVSSVEELRKVFLALLKDYCQ